MEMVLYYINYAESFVYVYKIALHTNNILV